MPTYPPNATFTPRLQLPRPGLDDVADGPDAFNDLTDVLDPIGVVFAQGTLAARPAAGTTGRLYWATDTKAIYYDDGTAWQAGAGSGSAGAALPILDVGTAGQIRAGRALTVADFTALGLSQPRGLWNLSDLSNLGSDGRALANKGAVGFASGINGAANTAAQFTGSTSQALYIADSGAADPYRIATGSFGCWFRTAKRAGTQVVFGKWGAAAGSFSWLLEASSAAGAIATGAISVDGSAALVANGVTDVCDDRWHFALVTFDGSALRLYVDGVTEAVVNAAGPIFGASGPLNVGANAADGATAAANPHFGRVDEAFVTADVLSDDQVRLLYAAKIAHGLGVVPTDLRVNVHRRRKGGAFAVGDFTAQPLRLHNFAAGALTDAGSNNTPVVNAGTAPVGVAGADGTVGNGFSVGATATAHLMATDAGLPAALAARTYGGWLKTTSQNGGVIGWGLTNSAADVRMVLNSGLLVIVNGADVSSGPYAPDGQWHFAVAVEDNAAIDGVKRKLYMDGRLVATSTVMTAVTLAGANAFQIGANPNGTTPLAGQIDGAFVCAYAMAQDEILRLYAKGGQDLGVSPKNAGDHIERATATDLLVIFDTLESQNTVDVGVAA
jgi:hypothetical protein